MRNSILFVCLLFTTPAHAADWDLMGRIVACESSGRPNVWGDDRTSYGIAQFRKVTFEEMKRKAHMPRLRWKNPADQLTLMSWMLDHGYGKRWTCYRKLMSAPMD